MPTTQALLQVEKSFLQNEGGYRDGSKHQKGRDEVITKTHNVTWHHPSMFDMILFAGFNCGVSNKDKVTMAHFMPTH